VGLNLRVPDPLWFFEGSEGFVFFFLCTAQLRGSIEIKPRLRFEQMDIIPT
jgi:hypothetical protein